MAEMIRDGRNRNIRNSSGYAAGRNRAGGLQWPGTARAGTHGPVPAGACMQGGRDDGSQQHIGAAQEQGGSASCCLGAQGEAAACRCTAHAHAHREKEGLAQVATAGPALLLEKKTTGGGAY